jgi:hypothetical protein
MADLPTELQWALDEAARLRDIANAELSESTAKAASRLSTGAPALDYLRRLAPGSAFETAGRDLFEVAHRFSARFAIQRLATLLEDWVAFAQAGMAARVSPQAAARVEAATDLMEQVQAMIDDKKTHAAAPIVLAGAALEEALRSLVIQNQANIVGKPSLNAYAVALKSASVLTTQDVKDVTSWAGQRNEAAHGDFDKLSIERAQIMVDGINLFMRQRLALPTP